MAQNAILPTTQYPWDFYVIRILVHFLKKAILGGLWNTFQQNSSKSLIPVKRGTQIVNYNQNREISHKITQGMKQIQLKRRKSLISWSISIRNTLHFIQWSKGDAFLRNNVYFNKDFRGILTKDHGKTGTPKIRPILTRVLIVIFLYFADFSPY